MQQSKLVVFRGVQKEGLQRDPVGKNASGRRGEMGGNGAEPGAQMGSVAPNPRRGPSGSAARGNFSLFLIFSYDLERKRCVG